LRRKSEINEVETRCRLNGTYYYWPAVACCPLVSYVAYALREVLQMTTLPFDRAHTTSYHVRSA